MRKSNKKSLRLLLVGAFLVVPVGAFAINAINDGYQVNSNGNQNINAHGTCQVVVNTSSKNYFIPTKTVAEWNSFRNAAAGLIGISLQNCPTPTPSPLPTPTPTPSPTATATILPPTPSPFCTANASQGCYNDDIYWFDSCGARGNLSKDCGADVCKDGACVKDEIPPPPPPPPAF